MGKYILYREETNYRSAGFGNSADELTCTSDQALAPAYYMAEMVAAEDERSEVEQLVSLTNYTLMPEEAFLIVANGYATVEHWLAMTVPDMMASGVEFNQAKKTKSLLAEIR